MAASYTWPATLPAPLVDNNEEAGLNILRTPMDKGPAKHRYRGERAEPLSLSFMLDATQMGTLDTFAKTTISGVARFYFTHPRTGATVEARFLPDQNGRLYSSDNVPPDYRRVSMMLEVLP